MKKTIIAILGLAISLQAYSAKCEAGKTFYITVENKVMTIDSKYKAGYKGKTLLGWYKYSNKAYTYKVGKFNNGQFPIEVSNKWGDEYEGTCYFE